jgi:hypothetical protein
MPIIKANTINLDAISFSDVKVDNHGRKMIYVNYNGSKEKIMIQTPKMYVPNGIKRWRKKDAVDNKEDSFELELSFGTGDSNDKNANEIREFHEKLQGFDTIVKQQILKCSKEWLGKAKISMDSIEEAFYAPSVRVAMDKDGNLLDYPSRVRAKLDRERDNDDNFSGRFLANKRLKSEVMIFDDSKTQLKFDENNFESVIPKGSQVVGVLELVYLSITTKVSAKWKLVQAKVSNTQTAITGYAMIDDDEPETNATGNDSNGVVPDDLDTEDEEVETPSPEADADAEAVVDDLDPEETKTPAPVKKTRAKK